MTYCPICGTKNKTIKRKLYTMKKNLKQYIKNYYYIDDVLFSDEYDIYDCLECSTLIIDNKEYKFTQSYDNMYIIFKNISKYKYIPINSTLMNELNELEQKLSDIGLNPDDAGIIFHYISI